MSNLTVKKIESLLAAGRKARVLDGQGLALQIRGPGRASWILRFTSGGRVRELGLGSFKRVGLADARAKAAEAKVQLAKGEDPIALKQRPTAKVSPSKAMTFGDATEAFWAAHQSRWRNLKVKMQWVPFMRHHGARLWGMAVSEVTHTAILPAIEPLWGPHPETAHRLLHRIGQVLDFSRVKGWRTGETPRMKGTFEYVLPKAANANQRHHHALPLAELPAFMARLEALPGTAALAFRFAILTASRVGEVFGMTWGEVEGSVWRIPAFRYKTLKEHLVPLSPAALSVLAACPRFADNPYVFPSPNKAGAPLSNMAIIQLLKRMGVKTTAHGTARSTFSDWAHDHTDFSHEVIEECMGHQTGNAVSRAYRRGAAIEKRRALLTEWSLVLTAPIRLATAAE
jgi:integrase